ncbi:MAG: sensor histidine kinase, partial [Flavisolibacter sp.]|nr:sensor histidine kinase [Flavisolibacter sp.]
LSDVCYSNQNFDSALYYADLSLQAATNLKINEEIQLARLSLIAALIRLKKWKEVDKQISVFTQTPQNNQNISLWVQFHSLLGNYYLAKGQHELSEHHYTWAIQQAKASNASELLAVVYGHMIDSYYDRGDYNKALSSLQQYKESRSNSQSDANTATTLKNDLYKNEIYNLSIEKKFKELQLLQETEKSKLKDVQLWQGEVMRSNLERKNRSKDSLLLLKDLLLQMEKWLSEAQARETKKEMALQQVKNEQSLKQKELRLKEAEQLTINLLVGLGTELLLGSSIFYQYRRQRAKNIIIEQQKLELQTLMKEIHHRVKNNLQVISSLLDLQAQSITDSRASEAVKEGRNRVLSMALIHQNLYGDRSIQQIKVKDYILSLSQSLIHSYNIQPGSISIHTEIDDLELDVDTVIPLGLILNELISNALKHAFKNRQSGEIHIVLKEKDSALHLRVKDNGAGFPAGAEFSPSPSFGWKLIKAFAAKLKAKLEMYNEEGACVALHIHNYKGAV